MISKFCGRQVSVTAPAHYHSSGWGGRIADLLHSVHNDSTISMNLSMSGNNFFQTGGNRFSPCQSQGDRRSDFRLRTSWRTDDKTKFETVKGMFDRTHDNLLERTFSDVNNTAIETSEAVQCGHGRGHGL